MTEDFSLGFTPEQVSGLSADAGTGFRRVGFGDYRLKITDGEIMPSKNAKEPHNMIKLFFEVVRPYDERNVNEVGSQLDGLYGTPQSPKFMQQRFKALLDACKVGVPKTGLKLSHLIGKEFDASVIWEMSDSKKLDEMGNKMYWVNARVKAERVVGTARPKTLNPTIESQKAVKYLDEGASAVEASAPAEVAAWEKTAAVPNGGAIEVTTPGYVPESEVDPTAHQYRAIYKLGGEESAQAKQLLVEAGYDPEGPVDVSVLPEDVKALYEAKFASAEKGGLKPLGKSAGTRQPRA